MVENITTINPSTMPDNSDIRAAARAKLNGHWSQPVVCTLVYYLVCYAASSIPLSFLATLPLAFGFVLTFLAFMRDENTEDMIGEPFKVFKLYSRYLGASLLKALIIFLWSLLLIIPGIVMSYAYAMTPYLCKDHPEMSVSDCISRSKAMMRGYKWKLFLLDLSFIGWLLLCCLSFGIGLFWVTPYRQCARAKFYEELKNIPQLESQAPKEL